MNSSTQKNILELPVSKGLYSYDNNNFLGMIKDLACELEYERTPETNE